MGYQKARFSFQVGEFSHIRGKANQAALFSSGSEEVAEERITEWWRSPQTSYSRAQVSTGKYRKCLIFQQLLLLLRVVFPRLFYFISMSSEKQQLQSTSEEKLL